MISATYIIRSERVNKKGECPIYLQLINNRKKKIISLGFTIQPLLWNSASQLPIKKYCHYLELKTFLDSKMAEINSIILDYKTKNKPLSINELVDLIQLNKKAINLSLIDYFDQTIMRLSNSGRIGYANIFNETRRQLINYSGKKDLSFQEIDFIFLVKFDEWFSNRGVTLNSVFVFMRTLKTLINSAKKEGLIEEGFNPFKDFSFIKYRRVKTRKRALNKELIESIKLLEYVEGTSLFETKNLFLFSYYCRGINFKDMAYLKWSDINGNNLEYTRKKTNGLFNMALNEPERMILSYYQKFKKSNDSYIFPILNEFHINLLQQDYRIKKVLKQVNKDLKEIAKTLKVGENLTFYAARHSFATISKKAGVPISMISEAMGHDSEQTTRIYLDSFGNDELNRVFQNVL